MDQLLGTILLWPINFAPKGWAYCEGQLLSIASNQALYSLLGSMYGGNGQTTFALPDFRGRVPVGAMGTGPGLTPYQLGQKGGVETVTLTTSEMPNHTHSLMATSQQGDVNTPGNTVLAMVKDGLKEIDVYKEAAPNAYLASSSISSEGGNQSHENRQPFLGMNFIITLQGIYPSRN